MFVLFALVCLSTCPEPPAPTLNNPCEQHCLPEQSNGCSVRNNTCHRSLALSLNWYLEALEATIDDKDKTCRRQKMDQALAAFSTSLDLHLSCSFCHADENRAPYSGVSIAKRLLAQCSKQYKWGHLDEQRVLTRLEQVKRLLRQEHHPGIKRLAMQLEAFISQTQPHVPDANG